jgi:hypothetical protein
MEGDAMLVRTLSILAALAVALIAVPAVGPTPPPIVGDVQTATSDTRARDARIDAYFARATAELRAAAGVALGSAAMAAPPPPPATRVRVSITALTAAQLTSLRHGFAQMRAWNTAPHGSANYKRSLVYWANMHAYIGGACSPASGINNQGMSGLSTQNATTPDEMATWCTCEHGTNEFLTWHRMYLYYFEQVLRAASGDKTLTLPFWDYESDGHVPAAYRAIKYIERGFPRPNPLYVGNRQAQLNNGTAALDPSVTSTSTAMSNTGYLGFDSALEQTPHGAVHCATGVAGCPTGYMGYVPSAGNDPIFYSHHANIDRLYECWLRVNQAARLPSGSIVTRQFSFIDGAGNLVTRTVSDMLTTQQLGYSYAAGGGCPRFRIPIKWLLTERPIHIFELAGPVRLLPGVTRAPIRITPDMRKAMATVIPERGEPPRAQLVLDGLAYDAPPGVLYKVYVEGAGKRELVGVINFFNATAPHHAMPGMEPAKPEPPRFDVTDAMRALGETADVRIALEPSTGLAGVSADVAAKQVNPKANVRIAAVRMELR